MTEIDIHHPHAPEPADTTQLRLRGQPPARTQHQLLEMMSAEEGTAPLVEATGIWLVSGKRTSERTRTAYAQDLSWWLHWCALRGKHPRQARPTEADLYAAALRETGLANSTVARRLSAASSWHAYLTRAEQADINPFHKMDRPKTGSDTSKTRGLTTEQVAAILNYACTHETARTCTVMWLLVSTGSRVGALLNADIGDLGYDTGHTVIDLRTKGNNVKRFILPPEAVDAINRYLAERGNPDTGPLLATRTGKRIDEPYVFRLVQRLAKKAGVPQHDSISPHSIRHSVATKLLDEGHQLHVVQDFLGHAYPDTTRIYDRARNSLNRTPAYSLTQSIAAAMDQLNPDR